MGDTERRHIFCDGFPLISAMPCWGPISQGEAMSFAEEFRAKAIECFERARRAQDSEYQRIYYNLAIQWLAWAAEIDGRGVVDPAILPPSAQRRRA